MMAKQGLATCGTCGAPCRATACERCEAHVCDDCAWNQPGSECPFCGAFGTFGAAVYRAKRAKCARLIFAHHGVAPPPDDHDGRPSTTRVVEIHTADGRKTLDECIDEMLTALGDRVY